VYAYATTLAYRGDKGADALADCKLSRPDSLCPATSCFGFFAAFRAGSGSPNINRPWGWTIYGKSFSNALNCQFNADSNVFSTAGVLLRASHVGYENLAAPLTNAGFNSGETVWFGSNAVALNEDTTSKSCSGSSIPWASINSNSRGYVANVNSLNWLSGQPSVTDILCTNVRRFVCLCASPSNL